MDIEFKGWPKIPRLFRNITITEKIDGTNACVIVADDYADVAAQSRNRIITPDDDNFGFARWVHSNAGALVDALGPGYHFGEWWGSGIQRGYGYKKGERFFSLFNAKRWEGEFLPVDGLGVVPVLWQGPFSVGAVKDSLDWLQESGSCATEPHRFDKPEGVVVYHHAGNQMFKALLENDSEPKGVAA